MVPDRRVSKFLYYLTSRSRRKKRTTIYCKTVDSIGIGLDAGLLARSYVIEFVGVAEQKKSNNTRILIYG